LCCAAAADAAFNHIAKMAKRNFRVPIALVSLVDDHRQWFKSCYGLDVMQTPRDLAFCAHAIMPDAPEIFEVPDATLDPRFSQNPLVTGDPNIRYYAGAPLVVNISPDTGPQKMGTLCVIDTTPRPPMDAEDRETLTILAAMVVDQLTSRLYSKRLAAINGELLQRTAEVNAINQELTSLIDTANAPIFAVDAAMRVTAWNRKISEITSIERREIEGQDICLLEGTFEEGDDESNSSRNRNSSRSGSSLSRSGSSLSFGTMLEAPIRRVLRQALAGERCACFDFEMRSKVHARRIQLQISVEPKRDPDGRVVGVVCVGEDVAMRRRMLEATMQNHELKRTNEAKDAFLACMSHEMRTPLNGLLGMLQLAMGSSGQGEAGLPDKVRRFLKQALNSGNLLLNLINDILDITRIEAGRLELDMRAFSLRALLEETIALVRPKALDKGLDLELDIEPALDGICQGALVGDSIRVQQVLLNLLWNALKFTPQGHVRLSARCTTCASPSCSFEKSSTSSAPLSAEDDSPASPPRAAGGEADVVHLIFEIADSGVGISPEDQTVIFERFARTHRSSAPENSGVGLGMSICKQLVELMGGRIWLHSELGKGSRVFVQLALALAHPQTAISSMTSVGSPTRDVLLLNDPMLPESPGLSGIAQPRTADVLIVEDNDYNVDVAKQMLELLGHRVTVAFDGWEAVSLIISRDCKRAWLPTSGKPFDLVLMDCDMPVMNGFQAARALRAWERTGVLPEPPTSLARAAPALPDRTAQLGPPSRPALPIIAVTAYAMSTDKDACFEAGMDDYITKPLSWPVLRDKVAVHVNSTALLTDFQTALAPGTELPAAATASVCGAANQLLAPKVVSREGSFVSRDTPLVALMKEHSRSMLQMPCPSSWETNSCGGGSGSFCGPASTSASVGGTLEPASATTAETTFTSGLATASTSFSLSSFASASASASPSASPQITSRTPSHDSVLALASDVPVAPETVVSISRLPEKPMSRPSSHSKLDADSEAGSIAASPLASCISSGASSSGAGSACGDVSCTASACGDVSCTASAEASSVAAPSVAVQSNAAAGRSPFSLSEIQNIFGGNHQLVRMALSRYDINAFERLRGPWEQRNFKRLGELAHQLKGTTSYICAGEAMRAAARLEQSAKALAAADTSEFLFEEVRDALRDMQRELELITPAVAAALQSLSQND
jgi:signal transduction histidine kinase/DNA-binding response OmpR family regulator